MSKQSRSRCNAKRKKNYNGSMKDHYKAVHKVDMYANPQEDTHEENEESTEAPVNTISDVATTPESVGSSAISNSVPKIEGAATDT